MSVRVFLLSRAWILLFAATAFAAFGADRETSGRYGDSPFTEPFGGVGDALVSVWSRWDSVWYLGIANAGYDFNPDSPAFFPLYPLLSRTLGVFGGANPPVELVFVAGVLVSLAALAGALYVLHRLVEVEVDRPTAGLAVALLAFFPMAVFYGAIYSESMFLLCSIAAVWFARGDRWALAGACGAAAAATRSAGVLIAVPLLLIYLLGPRGIGAGARPYLGVPWGRAAPSPRTYELRRDALWMLLVPAGTLAYLVYLWIATGDPWRFGDAQALWGREFGHFGPIPVGPIAGLASGFWEAFRGLAQILSGDGGTTVWSPDGAQSLRGAGLNVEAFLFLAFGVVATVGVLRRLPLAYGAYALAMLAFPLSFPRDGVPLFSMPRFVAVVFPLFIWLAIWIRERHWERPALILSAAALALYSAQWATWQWVA